MHLIDELSEMNIMDKNTPIGMENFLLEDRDEEKEEEEDPENTMNTVGEVAGKNEIKNLNSEAKKVAFNERGQKLQPSGRVVSIIKDNHQHEEWFGFLKPMDNTSSKTSGVRRMSPKNRWNERKSKSPPKEITSVTKRNSMLSEISNSNAHEDDESTKKESQRKERTSNIAKELHERYVIFVPLEEKFPRVSLPIEEIPDFDWSLYERKLISVEYLHWPENAILPRGRFLSVLGTYGNIDVETEVLLKRNKIEKEEFPEEILERDLNLKVSEEFCKRRDLRGKQIFTIDPTNARDLDDALHLERRSSRDHGQIYEVGVHIADVSFFAKPHSKLDEMARRRSTSTYLVQKAIPMLPRVLCEDLCSLNPGVDRLAFSVVWTLNESGQILEEWFGRTVIRSCCRLTYDIAQKIIEEKISDSWKDVALLLEKQSPRSSSQERSTIEKLKADLGPFGGHHVADICQSVRDLHKLASVLRQKRFETGALSISLEKSGFLLDSIGQPLEMFTYEIREANHLVEEFMVLANVRVAQKISDAFPGSALLRNHPSPNARKLKKLSEFCRNCKSFDLRKFDIRSSKAIADSLNGFRESLPSEVFKALLVLARKPMQLARYFCSGDMEPSEWRHYALNVERYTHFTSPIRRYPDIIVHRLLYAALLPFNNSCSSTGMSLSSSSLPANNNFEDSSLENTCGFNAIQLSSLSEHCNEQKLRARRAQEQSIKLFRCILLAKKPIYGNAILLELSQRSLLLTLIHPLGDGDEIRILLSKINGLKSSHYERSTNTLTLLWYPILNPKMMQHNHTNNYSQVLKVLSPIRVCVSVIPNSFPADISVTVLHPDEIEG